jgi:amidase
MARTVLDVALMFDAIAGPDPLDPTSLHEPALNCASAARNGSMKGLRIGVDPNYTLAGLDEPTAKALKAAIALMETSGAQIIVVNVPDVHPYLERAVAALFVEAAISHASNNPSQKQSYSAGYAEILDIGRRTSVLDYAAITIWRREFHGRLMQIFETVDLIVAPALTIEPPTVTDMAAILSAPPLSIAPMVAGTIPFNLAGVPSLTLPMGRGPSGVPLGFQLIGPDLAEASLLSAGAAYELAAGYTAHHPAI